MTDEMNESLDEIQQNMHDENDKITMPPLEVHVRPKPPSRLQSFIRICFAVGFVCVSVIATFGYFKSIFERENLTNELRCRSVASIDVNEANSKSLAIILRGLRAYGNGDIVGLQEALDGAPEAETNMDNAIAAQRASLTECHDKNK